ncbi:hypothetical protein BB560_006389, partial [Smittium megazygosporum]
LMTSNMQGKEKKTMALGQNYIYLIPQNNTDLAIITIICFPVPKNIQKLYNMFLKYSISKRTMLFCPALLSKKYSVQTIQ